MALYNSVNEPWGTILQLHQTSGFKINLLTVDPGKSSNLQQTVLPNKQILMLTGQAEVQIDKKNLILKVPDVINISNDCENRIANNTSKPISVLEVQYGNIMNDEDLAEITDRYSCQSIETGYSHYTNHTPPVFISEMGCNHKGEMKIALEMITMAANFCNVEIIKFQKRNNRELLTPEEYATPHPNPTYSYGTTYGEHREYLEFDLAQHRILKNACEEKGCIYSSSVWDTTSAREIASLEPQLIKIPSAINTNGSVLDILLQEYGGEVHISLGMTRRKEEELILEHANRTGRLQDIVLYHCISGYPIQNEDLYLLDLRRLISSYGEDVKAIGFSGHHTGIAADIAALTLGATYFERHFTLDRTWKGTDHAASLEPDGMRRLARDLKSVKLSLKLKPDEIADVELVQRKKLKKNVSLPNYKLTAL